MENGVGEVKFLGTSLVHARQLPLGTAEASHVAHDETVGIEL